MVLPQRLLGGILDARNVGIDQRRNRLRTVKAGQVDQRDTEFLRERRQHRIERVGVGQQRMQDDEIAAFPGADGRGEAVRGGELLKF